MRSIEADLAATVEHVVTRDEGRRLGIRTRRDGRDSSGLLVDFTYDDAEPPVALEITSVQDESFLAAGSAGRKLAERLTARFDRMGLSHYRITVHEHAKMRDLDDLVLEAVRADVSSPTGYTSDDLVAWTADGSVEDRLDLLRRLDAAGIAELLPAPRDPAVSVSTWGETDAWPPLQGLEHEIGANLDKLIACGSAYEHHLVIGVGRYAVNRQPSRTPVPDLPAGMDRLWLIFLWTGVDGSRAVWSTASNDHSWRVHESVRASTGV